MIRLEKEFKNPYATFIALFASKEEAERVFDAVPDTLAVSLTEEGLWGVEVIGVKRAYRLMHDFGGIDFAEIESPSGDSEAGR